jgi:DNA-binding CsgD family transcriptional regulator
MLEPLGYMRASARTQAVGCDDGKFLIARCPRDWDVSTPQSLWKESPYAESLAYTLGRWLPPADTHRRTLIHFIAPTKRAMRAIALSDREWTMLREYKAERNYAAIGRKHGLTRERVRQILMRAQKVAAYRRAVGLASPDDEPATNPTPRACQHTTRPEVPQASR